MWTIIFSLLCFSIAFLLDNKVYKKRDELNEKLIKELKIQNLNLLEAGSASLKVLHGFLKSNFPKEGYARIWMHDKLWTFRVNEKTDVLDISVSEDDIDYYKPESDILN